MKNRKIKSLTAGIIIMTMCIAFAGCAQNGGKQTESTTATTAATAAQKETQKAATEKTTAAEEARSSENSTAKADYKAIYKDYDAKMKTATAEYVEALKKEASGTSDKNDFYDKTQSKLEDLKKIKEEGAKAMIDAMLKSTEDDADSYEKWFAELSSAYSDYSREITSVYTDSF